LTKEKYYSDKEERLNIWSHAVGIGLSSVGLIFLILKSQGTVATISSIVFGGSLILLYSASTRYHSEKNADKRARYRIFDHAAIFVLIAGTYTPLAAISLSGRIGNYLLMIIWGIAVAGIVLKLFFTGRYHLLSTVLYVIMGWTAIFVIKPLIQRVEPGGLWLIGLGGVAYTLGAILYSRKKLPYNHAIFHLFVLAGSAFHYFSIYLFVI